MDKRYSNAIKDQNMRINVLRRDVSEQNKEISQISNFKTLIEKDIVAMEKCAQEFNFEKSMLTEKMKELKSHE